MDNYEALEIIGKGSFGSVQKIRRKSDGKILVWKELDYGKMSEKEKHLLVSEVNILREFRHPHIVRYYDRIIDKSRTKIFIVMEFCAGGDLAAYIKKCRREKRRIDEEVIWKVFLQMGLALQECHVRKEGTILHRDLKPANVFLDADNNVKLGDFGLARMMGSESLFARTHVGTPYYMSPEQISKKAYNERTDIWALGCILYEMACLHTPFEAHNEAVLAAKIKAGRIHKLPSCYSDSLARAVYSMIQVDMSKRPRIQDLLALPQVATRLAKQRAPSGTTALKAEPAAPTTAKNKPTTTADNKYKPSTADKYKPAADNTTKYRPAAENATKYKPSDAAAKYKPSDAAAKYKPSDAAAKYKPTDATPKYENATEAAGKRPTLVLPTRQAAPPTRPATAVAPVDRSSNTEMRDREEAAKKKECELCKRETAVATRERQVALREKDVERRAKLADEQLAKAEKMMQEYKNTVAAGRTKATIPAVPMFDTKDRKTPVPSVPLFDGKENASDGKYGKNDASDTQSTKPLQPLHNIYDRREKLLARLLNHRMGTAE